MPHALPRLAQQLRTLALRFTFFACTVLLAGGLSRAESESLPELEERAMKAAVARVAPAVVRIETIGGLERIGNVLFGSGPTTGLIVTSDGYVVSSAFSFAQRPESILVTLPGGARRPAKLVATDHSRKIVLLKVTSDDELPVAVPAPAESMHPGQWAIAVGRTFEGSEPNISVGIVSAVNRIWSKAIQTDAKISPSNYGGPLVDIRGRVLGVLAPLTPDSNATVAGIDWYDSGIGFAVPLAHILSILPRMRDGKDLHAGILGVNLAPGDQFSQPALIAACRVDSPAYKAGLRAGDKIVEIDGQSVVRQTEFKHRLNTRYAGDKVQLVIVRAGERLTKSIELTDKLAPYEFPFVGILPRRDRDQKGVAVRYVYPDGPAEQAGLKAGDVITGVDGKEVERRATIVTRLQAIGPDEELPLEVKRGDETLKLKVKLGRVPEAIPGELPASHKALPAAKERPPVGTVQLQVPEFSNECTVYVPESYHPQVPHGVLVHLHAPGDYRPTELVDLWKAACTEHDLILVAPKAADVNKWQPSEAAYVRRALGTLAKTYELDRQRIVMHGQQGGGSLAFVVAFGSRELVRGVAVIDAAVPAIVTVPDSDPLLPLAVYMATAEASTSAPQIRASIDKLRGLKYPVSIQAQGPQPRALTMEEVEGLARWIDSLDRL